MLTVRFPALSWKCKLRFLLKLSLLKELPKERINKFHIYFKMLLNIFSYYRTIRNMINDLTISNLFNSFIAKTFLVSL